MDENQVEAGIPEGVVIAYRQGLQADIVQGRVVGIWGAVWTVPSLSTPAMEKVGRQMTRARADMVRHYRRARLRRRIAKFLRDDALEVIISTELPSRTQIVVLLSSRQQIYVDVFLQDDALAALISAFLTR